MIDENVIRGSIPSVTKLGDWLARIGSDVLSFLNKDLRFAPE
jgi:hypothetical protein